jgi:hypothetical protein
MSDTQAAELRRAVVVRLSSGEQITAVAADTGISRSPAAARPTAKTAAEPRTAAPPAADVPAVPPAKTTDGKLADITGPGITETFGGHCHP